MADSAPTGGSSGSGSGSTPTQQADPPKTDPNAPPPKADLADTAKDLLLHYASENLKGAQEQALHDLAKAWKESPGGVVAAAAILGGAGVTYLVKTGSSLPSIPPIPLDFLAGREPMFKGAEMKVELSGPVTSPTGIKVSVTFHEQAPKRKEPSHSGSGHVLPTRLGLRNDSIKAAKPDSGTEVIIEGQVPIPSKADPADVSATKSAIEDGKVEVDFGGTPAGLVEVISVEDNYKPDKFGLGGTPAVRFLTVRIRTSIPPMFHQGAEEVVEIEVWVRINGTSSEGQAKMKVRMRTLPTP